MAGSALILLIVEDGVAVCARDRRRVMRSLAVSVLRRLMVVLAILIFGTGSSPIAAPIEVLALRRVI